MRDHVLALTWLAVAYWPFRIVSEVVQYLSCSFNLLVLLANWENQLFSSPKKASLELWLCQSFSPKGELFKILESFWKMSSYKYFFFPMSVCLPSWHHQAWDRADWQNCSKGSPAAAVRCPGYSVCINLMTHIKMDTCHKTLQCHVSVTSADVLSHRLAVSIRILLGFPAALTSLQKLDRFYGFT